MDSIIGLITQIVTVWILVFLVVVGNVEACQNVKRVILEWAKANVAQRTGPSDGKEDTGTIL